MTDPARGLGRGILAPLAGAWGSLSGLRGRVEALSEGLGARVRLPSQQKARLQHLYQGVRRQLAGGMWAVAAVGALLILAVILVVTVGGHSGSHARERGALTGWAAISSPAQGGVYPRSQWVATTFQCGRTSGGPALKSCRDSTGSATVSGGHGHLDTSSTGTHRYTVAATVTSGATKTTSITYTVVPPPRASIGTGVATAAHSRTNLTIACSGGGTGAACSGVVTLTVGQRVVHRVGQRTTATVQTVTLARASYSLAAGARRSIVVPLTTAGTLALRAAPGHRMQVRATVTVTNGATTERAITLKRRQRR